MLRRADGSWCFFVFVFLNRIVLDNVTAHTDRCQTQIVELYYCEMISASLAANGLSWKTQVRLSFFFNCVLSPCRTWRFIWSQVPHLTGSPSGSGHQLRWQHRYTSLLSSLRYTDQGLSERCDLENSYLLSVWLNWTKLAMMGSLLIQSNILGNDFHFFLWRDEYLLSWSHQMPVNQWRLLLARKWSGA